MVSEVWVDVPVTALGTEGVEAQAEPATSEGTMNQPTWIKPQCYFLRAVKVLGLVQPKEECESHEK